MYYGGQYQPGRKKYEQKYESQIRDWNFFQKLNADDSQHRGYDRMLNIYDIQGTQAGSSGSKVVQNQRLHKDYANQHLQQPQINDSLDNFVKEPRFQAKQRDYSNYQAKQQIQYNQDEAYSYKNLPQTERIQSKPQQNKDYQQNIPVENDDHDLRDQQSIKNQNNKEYDLRMQGIIRERQKFDDHFKNQLKIKSNQNNIQSQQKQINNEIESDNKSNNYQEFTNFEADKQQALKQQDIFQQFYNNRQEHRQYERANQNEQDINHIPSTFHNPYEFKEHQYPQQNFVKNEQKNLQPLIMEFSKQENQQKQDNASQDSKTTSQRSRNIPTSQIVQKNILNNYPYQEQLEKKVVDKGNTKYQQIDSNLSTEDIMKRIQEKSNQITNNYQVKRQVKDILHFQEMKNLNNLKNQNRYLTNEQAAQLNQNQNNYNDIRRIESLMNPNKQFGIGIRSLYS